MDAKPTLNVTRELARFAAAPIADTLPDEARRVAALCLADWAVCAIAGTGEPVSRVVRALHEAETGVGYATVLGSPTKGPARIAALANGATSHALDYDDTHFAYVGHPSVAVYPAALAAAEALDRPARDLLDAFAAGAEIAVRIGRALGLGHYNAGFHQTATSGTFGAAAAAGRLVGLGPERLSQALSIASTRAAGLKSQFGTMGKPLNAGFAASNGVEAALLAECGLVSCDDGIGGPQGFVSSHPGEGGDLSAVVDGLGTDWLFRDVQFKFHACCHGLHPALEALGALRRRGASEPEAIARVEIRTAPRWLKVCDIRAPRTGLEAKFSYALTAAMALGGHDTARLDTYSDESCRDRSLTTLSHKVEVVGEDSLADTEADVRIALNDGAELRERVDIADRPALDMLADRLAAKASAVLGRERAAALASAIGGLDDLSAREFAAVLSRLALATAGDLDRSGGEPPTSRSRETIGEGTIR